MRGEYDLKSILFWATQNNLGELDGFLSVHFQKVTLRPLGQPYLAYTPQGLCFFVEDAKQKPFFFDLDLELTQFQKQRVAKGPLAKALSLGAKPWEKTVVDCTLGTGKDACLILSWGAKVVGYERHPLVYALVKDAHLRMKSELKKHLEVRWGSFLEAPVKADVLYFDPMYPQKSGPKKSALPRKEMQVFREFVGMDEDWKTSLLTLIRFPVDRIVLKRGTKQSFDGLTPLAVYEGKSTRYELYRPYV